jgi:glutaredoxin
VDPSVVGGAVIGLWTWLSRWWKRRRTRQLDVILYTRQGCHLCETAHEQLEQARRHWGFQLSIVDVDTDPALVERHGNWVPVVAIDGQVRFRGHINPVMLERTLRGSS